MTEIEDLERRLNQQINRINELEDMLFGHLNNPSSVTNLSPHPTALPQDIDMKMPRTMHTASWNSLGPAIRAIRAAAPASTALTANRAYFIPFEVHETINVSSLWVMNGATVSGNLSVGIYNEAHSRLVVSANTAQSGINSVQAISITNTELSPGRYYMAVAADNGTATLFAWSANNLNATFNFWHRATAFPLPQAGFDTLSTELLPLIGVNIYGLVSYIA